MWKPIRESDTVKENRLDIYTNETNPTLKQVLGEIMVMRNQLDGDTS